MADRYLHPRVAELVSLISRRPPSHAEDRIRRDGRRFYKDAKKARLAQLLREEARTAEGGGVCIDARRKLTNLASAEASRKKKQYIQERSFQALRRKAAAEMSLVRAICTLVAANERQRRENVRISSALAKCGGVAAPAGGVFGDSGLADSPVSGTLAPPEADGHCFPPVLDGFVMHPSLDGVEDVKPDVLHGEHEGDHELALEAGDDPKRQTNLMASPEAVDDFSSVSSDKFLDMD